MYCIVLLLNTAHCVPSIVYLSSVTCVLCLKRTYITRRLSFCTLNADSLIFMNAASGSQRHPAPLPRGSSSPANRRKHGRSRTRKSERGSSVRVSSRSSKVIDLNVNRKRMWLPSYYHSIDNYVLCYYSSIIEKNFSLSGHCYSLLTAIMLCFTHQKQQK